ncbi:MAG: CHAT domain-containing tetratricopeptide repeat protein [Bacteroidota bacterium]
MKAYPILSTILLVFSSPVIQAQSPHELDDSQRDSLFKVGLAHFEKSEEVFYESLDSCLYYTELSMNAYKAGQHWNNYIETVNAMMAVNYYKGQYAKAEEYAFFALEEAKKYLPKDAPEYYGIYNNIGVSLQEKNDYVKANEYLQESLSVIKESNGKKNYLATILENISDNYFSMLDYEESYRYRKMALDVLLDAEGINPLNVANAYYRLASAHFHMDEITKAHQLLHKSLNIAKDKKGDFAARININNYQYLSQVWQKWGRRDSAYYYAQQMLQLQPTAKSYRKIYSYRQLAAIDVDNQNNKSAINNYNKALDTYKARYPYEKHTLKAITLYDLSDVYQKLGKLNKALDYSHQAVQANTLDFQTNDVSQNPGLSSFLSDADALVYIHRKADLFLQLHQQSPNPKNLRSAHQTYQLCAELIQQIRQDYLSESAKHELAQKALAVYEGAITACLELYQNEQDPKYIEQAFAYAESNKAILLLESLNETAARGFGGIPDSLQAKETEMKLEIAFYEKQIKEEQQYEEEVNAEKMKSWEARLFNLRRDYQHLIDGFERDFPQYHKLKYDTQLAQLSEIQSTLQADEILIEYFIGENKQYVFAIWPDKAEVLPLLTADSLAQYVEVMRQQLIQPPLSGDQLANYQAFTQNSAALYQALLYPILKDQLANIGRLIIIPDDFLGYLPFEALLSEPAAQKPIAYSPRQLQYLYEDAILVYDYSATLWLIHKEDQPLSTQEFAHNFIGFAPAFKKAGTLATRNCTSDELYSLQCSEDEVGAIRDMVSGDVLLNQSASKAAFEELAPKARIIHLATHACVDEEDPMLSKIFLTDNYLTAYDLSGLQLEAELVVLSACNTGFGKLVRGEGVMSLSRNFFNAGCPSTLMSLWSVDDCATSEMMIRFYEQLEKGLNKDQAIRQARMDYLDNTDKLHQHPYYWAAFIQLGNPVAIEFGGGMSQWLFYLLGALVLVLLAYFGLRQKGL